MVSFKMSCSSGISIERTLKIPLFPRTTLEERRDLAEQPHYRHEQAEKKKVQILACNVRVSPIRTQYSWPQVDRDCHA